MDSPFVFERFEIVDQNHISCASHVFLELLMDVRYVLIVCIYREVNNLGYIELLRAEIL